MVNMKRMGGQGFINGRRIAPSSSSSIVTIGLFLFLFFVVNITLSNCFKTMTTVHKLKEKELLRPVSYINNVPSLWKPNNHSTKSFPSTVVSKSFIPSSGACQTSSSKLSADCLKPKKKMKHQPQRKVNKFSSGSGSSNNKNGAFREKDIAKLYNVHNRRTAIINSVKHSNKISNSNVSMSYPQVPKSFSNLSKLTSENILEINKFVRKKRHYCKVHNFAGFTCQKLKLSLWLAKQMERNVTKLNSWMEIVRNSENANVTATGRSSSKDLRDVKPENWPEKIAYRLIKAWGDPEDLFVFYKYKDFVNSRELKISLPYKVELKVAPKTSSQLDEESKARTALSPSLAQESARWFWDPGFNLKLKLPFFRDELKVAVSTGPSFVAGIGVGIALLIIKGMFAPFLFGLKWMVYNLFFKESSPYELMKMLFLSHAPSETWENAVPPPSIDHYRPPIMHNPYDNPGNYRPSSNRHHIRPPPPPRHHRPYHHPFNHGMKDFGPPPPPHYSSPMGMGPSMGPSPYDLEYSPPPPYDMNHQFTHPTPMISTLAGVNPTMSQLEELYRAQLLEEGLGLNRPTYKSLLPPDPTNSLDMSGTDGPGMDGMDGGMESDHQDGQSYIPSTGLQAEVEHFDPFYSPLLSKIDSIFTHLGHSDEGCRERVVCSIYKFPVKYAPYSNLLSAQLSKHQSELKRPVSSSTKILRYFRYMKAAKDGQGGENCGELYPKCESDTDSVSSLPMITTFHQLSELMTAEASSPGVSLAAAG